MNTTGLLSLSNAHCTQKVVSWWSPNFSNVSAFIWMQWACSQHWHPSQHVQFCHLFCILAYRLYMSSRHAHVSPVSCWTEYPVWVTIYLYIRGLISGYRHRPRRLCLGLTMILITGRLVGDTAMWRGGPRIIIA